MLETKYKIGQTIEDTVAFGPVFVKDIFISTTNPDWFCYRVEQPENAFNSFLCDEDELESFESSESPD